MAYIDREKAISELQVHSEREDKKSIEMLNMGNSDAHEKYLHGAYCYIVAQQILNDLPTEDVAPKAEKKKIKLSPIKCEKVCKLCAFRCNRFCENCGVQVGKCYCIKIQIGQPCKKFKRRCDRDGMCKIKK